MTDRNALMRLSAAAEAAFPDGSMTLHGLRKEHARGRLDIWRIAGKDYTSLAAIERMRERCLLPARAPGSGCDPLDGTAPAGSAARRSTSSWTEDANAALAAARMTLQGLKKPSTDTSAKRVSPRRRKAPVIQLVSLSPTS